MEYLVGILIISVFVIWARFSFKSKNNINQILLMYWLAGLSCAGVVWVNYFYIDVPSSNLLIMIFAIIPNIIYIIKTYSKALQEVENIKIAHYCIGLIFSVVFAFSIIYSIIEIAYPKSFSDIASTDFIGRTVDFIYFSVTTFTTTGFGDIAPQTTLAKAVVTLEIIAAFIMIAIAMNLFVFKKDTNCTDGELDEITKW